MSVQYLNQWMILIQIRMKMGSDRIVQDFGHSSASSSSKELAPVPLQQQTGQKQAHTLQSKVPSENMFKKEIL